MFFIAIIVAFIATIYEPNTGLWGEVFERCMMFWVCTYQVIKLKAGSKVLSIVTPAPPGQQVKALVHMIGDTSFFVIASLFLPVIASRRRGNLGKVSSPLMGED